MPALVEGIGHLLFSYNLKVTRLATIQLSMLNCITQYCMSWASDKDTADVTSVCNKPWLIFNYLLQDGLWTYIISIQDCYECIYKFKSQARTCPKSLNFSWPQKVLNSYLKHQAGFPGHAQMFVTVSVSSYNPGLHLAFVVTMPVDYKCTQIGKWK